MSPTWREHAVATGTAAAAFWMLALGAPVLDTVAAKDFATPAKRTAYRARVPAPWSELTGIFPWAMLALYPALVPGLTCRLLDAAHARGVPLPPILRPAAPVAG